MRDGYLTVAGLVLFDTNPSVFLPRPEFEFFVLPALKWKLINTVVRRNYAFAGDYIRVSIYDDRLEIISPGRLPNTVALDNMRETSYSRNPRIARILVEFGWVREINEGVKRNSGRSLLMTR